MGWQTLQALLYARIMNFARKNILDRWSRRSGDSVENFLITKKGFGDEGSNFFLINQTGRVWLAGSI